MEEDENRTTIDATGKQDEEAMSPEEQLHPLVYSMARTSRDLLFFDLGTLHECVAQIMRGTAEWIEYAPQLEDVRVWETDSDLETGKGYATMLEVEVRAFCKDLDLKYLKYDSEGRWRYLIGKSLEEVRKVFAEVGGEKILEESSETKPYSEWEAPQDFDRRIGSSRFPRSSKKRS